MHDSTAGTIPVPDATDKAATFSQPNVHRLRGHQFHIAYLPSRGQIEIYSSVRLTGTANEEIIPL